MSEFISRKYAEDVAISMTKAAYEDCAKLLDYMIKNASDGLLDLLARNKKEDHRALALMVDGGCEFMTVAADVVRKKAANLELALSESGGSA